jgi:hypothetical protein
LTGKLATNHGQNPSWRLHVHLVDWGPFAAHVRVFDKHGSLITRVNLETMRPMDISKIGRKMLVVIRELQNEGRL